MEHGETLSFPQRPIARAHLYRTLRHFIQPTAIPRTPEGIAEVLSITERTGVEGAKSVRDLVHRSRMRAIVTYPAFYQLAQVFNSDVPNDFLTLEDASGGFEVTPAKYGLLLLRNAVPELMEQHIEKGVTGLMPGGFAFATTDSEQAQALVAKSLQRHGFTIIHNEPNQSKVIGITYQDPFVLVGQKTA